MTRTLWNDLEADHEDATGIFAHLARILGDAEPMGGYDMWTLPGGLWMVENERDGWTVMYPEDY